uniref:Uncharacterized protein n=1 Tax=Timema bartmani TaxID=61472 RepID=A0A7R9FA97_9NEOP|nr:unnamed protein product [Timema bartmani]
MQNRSSIKTLGRNRKQLCIYLDDSHPVTRPSKKGMFLNREDMFGYVEPVLSKIDALRPILKPGCSQRAGTLAAIRRTRDIMIALAEEAATLRAEQLSVVFLWGGAFFSSRQQNDVPAKSMGLYLGDWSVLMMPEFEV